MFPLTDKNKRKYQCFVCAQNFEEFDKFKEHITEKHEEGREYVICPLQRCQAPVRDLRMHFKVKHPHEKLPHIGQMKAIIWKDISPKGKVKTRKPKFRQGFYESTKMQKSFYYRSGYEATTYECLDVWHEVHGYDAEPFEIPYTHNGNVHKYTPDLFVVFTNGEKEVWEIKPSNQTTLEQNKNKWFAAEQACKTRGWTFRVVTEQYIEKLKKLVQAQ